MPTAAARALRSSRSGKRMSRADSGADGRQPAPPDRERKRRKDELYVKRNSPYLRGTFTGENRRVTEVVTDSRSCGMPAAPLFVAMCGARHDSHGFRRRDVCPRCAGVSGRTSARRARRAGYVVVGNAIDALQRLAADWRRRFGGTVVGDHRLRTARRSSRSGSPRRRPTA